MINLNPVSELLNRIPLTVYRAEAAGYGEDGRWQEQQYRTIDINCSIQPFWRRSTSGKERINLPEGASPQDVLVVYTQSPLIPISIIDNTVADKIVVDGKVYYLHLLRNWARHSLSLDHYEGFFVLEEEWREDYFPLIEPEEE